MNKIIKSESASEVVLLRSPDLAPPLLSAASSAHELERQSMLQHIARLEATVRQYEAEAEDLRSKIVDAQEAGRSQGYEAGLAAAEDRQFERLDMLGKAMIDAHSELKESIQSVIRLAPLLAQDCVDIVLGAASDRAEFIARIIEKQLATLDRSMLVRIRLSRLDFPNEEELALLASRLGLGALQLSVGDDILAGGCTMALKLGSIDVGINQQWPALRKLLEEMSLPETIR